MPVAVLLALWGVAGGWAPPVQENRALALLEEAGRRYREIHAFCADFHQVLEVPLLGETTRSRGRLCQERPNRFAMRFSDPPGDVVVADGTHFWVYFPSADPGQVLQFPMEERPGGLDFQREFLEDPGSKYELRYLGEEAVGGRRSHLISAVPRAPASFVAARIWLDAAGSLILRAEIRQENESLRTLTLSAVDLSPPSDPGRFRFSPPPGTQVIRRGGSPR